MRKAFAERLTDQMERCGVTISDLASALCITDGAVYKYTRGERVPRRATLTNIAKLLDTTPEYLLTGRDV